MEKKFLMVQIFFVETRKRAKQLKLIAFLRATTMILLDGLRKIASKDVLWFCFLSCNGIASPSLSVASSAEAFYTCDFNLYAHPSIVHPYTLDT